MSGFRAERCWLVIMLSVCVLLSGCKEVAYEDLNEHEVNEMLALLDSHGVSAEKRSVGDGRYQLAVEDDKLASAIRLLRQQGYPRERFANMGDVFEKTGLLSSPAEERGRFIYALQQSVAETLTQIDGVMTARVHFVIPNNDPFDKGAQPASASVLIQHHPDVDLSSVQSDLKLLVQQSIEGLAYDSITLVLLPAHDFRAGVLDPTGTGAASDDGTGWLFATSLATLFGGAMVYLLGRRILRRHEAKPAATTELVMGANNEQVP